MTSYCDTGIIPRYHAVNRVGSCVAEFVTAQFRVSASSGSAGLGWIAWTARALLRIDVLACRGSLGRDGLVKRQGTDGVAADTALVITVAWCWAGS